MKDALLETGVRDRAEAILAPNDLTCRVQGNPVATWIAFLTPSEEILLSEVTYTLREKRTSKDLVREPLRYWKGDGNVTFTKPFLMLGKVTFDAHVNILERYCKGGILYTFTKP